MDAEKVLKLIDAGFSADEIRGMLGSAPAEEAPKIQEPSQPEIKEEPKEAPAATPAPAAKEDPKEDPIAKAINEHLESIFKPIEDRFTAMAKLAGMPSLDSVQPKGVDDIIKKFFKED